MPFKEVTRIGKRGTVVIPAELRRRLGLEEGSHVIIEESEDGVVIHGAVVMPVEIYTPERKAEFLLSNAVDKDDYEWAVAEVHRMGLDPDAIVHEKPPGV